MNTIIGIYRNKEDAEAAAEALNTAGIDPHYIHLIADDEVKNFGDFHTGSPSQKSKDSLPDEAINTMLEKAGFEEGDVDAYREKVRQGQVALMARAMYYQEEPAAEIARRHNPIQVEEKDLLWHEDARASSKTDRSPKAPTTRQFYAPPLDDFAAEFRHHYESENALDDDFTAYLPAYRYGYELALESDLRGQTWVEVEATAAEKWQEETAWDELKGAVKHAWETVRKAIEGGGAEAEEETLGYEERRSDFHEHYNRHYAPQGLPFERYEPAYRFGAVLGEDVRYQERPWSEIIPLAQERWRRDHPNEGDWDDVSEAVRYGWKKGQAEDVDLMK